MDLNRRYQTVADLIADLERAFGSVPSQQADHSARPINHADQQVHVHIHTGTDQPVTGSAATGHVGSHPTFGPPDIQLSAGDQSSVRTSLSADEGFDRRAGELFVGREEEQQQVESVLFTAERTLEDQATVVYVHGSPGIGKSYLISRVLHQRRSQLQGPVIRLVLERDQNWTLDRLRDVLADRLRVSAGRNVWIELRAAFYDGILQVENVDTAEVAASISQLVEKLSGCRLLLSGRWFDAGGIPNNWNEVEIVPLSQNQAAEQFERELQSAGAASVWERFSDEQRTSLLARTGSMPLAIHLASGYLAAKFPLDVLLQKLPELSLRDISDPRFGQQVLRVIYGESLGALKTSLAGRRPGEDEGVERLMSGFHRLGFGSLTGMGRALAGAVAGLDAFNLAELLDVAETLHLIERDDDGLLDRFRLHPLLAEILAASADEAVVNDSLTDWFVERLPRPMAGDPRVKPWQNLHEEYETLANWLPLVPASRVFEVIAAGLYFLFTSGPAAAWIALCERAETMDRTDDEESIRLRALGYALCQFPGADSDDIQRGKKICERKLQFDEHRGLTEEASHAAFMLGDVLSSCGELDEALRLWQAKAIPGFDSAGCDIEKAWAQGRIADVLQNRGDLDAALRIRLQEELPVYELHGDVHNTAITQGKIANVARTRGEMDEALRIHREIQLPVYEQLGDVHGKAVTQSMIADVLRVQGDHDEAIRIWREDVIPVYERIGDARSKAVTQGKIADELHGRGELEEALRIRREKELPVYERLGDIREKAVTQGKIAYTLSQQKDFDAAIRLYREEVLPTFKTLGVKRDVAMSLANLAHIFLARREGRDVRRAEELFNEALPLAEEMKIPEAEEFRKMLKDCERLRKQKRR